jgi:hypothetical protein
MTTVLRAHTCLTCRHGLKEPNNQIQCRRFPPIPTPIVAPTPQGPKLVTTVTSFPLVRPDQWCGEHTPVLTVER